MWHPREPRSILDAAEKAAAAGNYVSAEKHLREVARLQEESLGPRHPDLANTLNNLGVVCEITGKPTDAEQYFRRAVSIARTSLDPDHPFVITSRKNLSDFCKAQGKSLELPTPAPTAPASASPPEPAKESHAEPAAEDPEATSRKFFSRLALGALGPISMLMIVLAAGLPRLGAPELAVPSRANATEPSPPVTPPPSPTHVEPAPVPRDTTPVSAATVTAPARMVVVRASLCADLGDWLCDPADRPVPSGPLFFYTQVKSTRATTIQHRWYQDDRLRQSVELRIQPAAAYRTYSRSVMTSDSTGNWRVELRSDEGALLHEERFTVH